MRSAACMCRHIKKQVMKPFDDTFADQVREVFDHYEDSPEPAGWEEMKGRLRSAKGFPEAIYRPLRVWVGVAAAVLGLMMVSVLVWETVFRDGMTRRFETADAPRPLLPAIAPFDMADPPVSLPVAIPITNPHWVQIPDDGPATAAQSTDTGVSMPHPVRMARVHLMRTSLMGPPPAAPSLVLPGSFPTELLWEYGPVRAEIPEYPMMDLPVAGLPVSRGREASTLSWDVAAGPMITYVERQMADGMGFSGGLTGRWNFARTLDLSSGVLLAYQQFSVTNLPMGATQVMRQDEKFPTLVSTEMVGDHDYELLSVDIPLNIRWSFMETQDRSWFLSAGVSSMLHLQQRVTGQTTAYVTEQVFDTGVGLSSKRVYSTTTEVSDGYTPLRHFDPAGLLNLSMGYESTGSMGFIALEPFVKIPINTLGARGIHMGMGGLVLRYRPVFRP